MAGEQRTWQVIFKLCLLLHTQARENARTLADLPEAVEALFQKVPLARQRLLTGFQWARSRGVLCKMQHVTYKFLSVRQSAVLTFPCAQGHSRWPPGLQLAGYAEKLEGMLSWWPREGTLQAPHKESLERLGMR